MIACVATPLVGALEDRDAEGGGLAGAGAGLAEDVDAGQRRGISSVWISDGVVNFGSASARRMDGRTPRAANASGTGGCSALSLKRNSDR